MQTVKYKKLESTASPLYEVEILDIVDGEEKVIFKTTICSDDESIVEAEALSAYEFSLQPPQVY
jgi:hypothetical protein